MLLNRGRPSQSCSPGPRGALGPDIAAAPAAVVVVVVVVQAEPGNPPQPGPSRARPRRQAAAPAPRPARPPRAPISRGEVTTATGPPLAQVRGVGRSPAPGRHPPRVLPPLPRRGGGGPRRARPLWAGRGGGKRGPGGLRGAERPVKAAARSRPPGSRSSPTDGAGRRCAPRRLARQ